MNAPVAPAAQKVAVAALIEATGLRVSTRKPTTPPPEFVVVSRIGGSSTTYATSNPRFLVECFAADELAAEQLAERVITAWRTMRTHRIIWSSDDGNLARWDDPDPDHHRFQFTGGLTILL